MTEEKPKRGALLYYQLASGILLLTLAGFSISGLWGVVKIGVPQLTVQGWEWRQVSSLEGFKEAKFVEINGLFYPKFDKVDTSLSGGITHARVQEKWKMAKADTLYEERRSGLQLILFWFVTVVICLPLYLYHHKAVKKGRLAMEQTGQ